MCDHPNREVAMVVTHRKPDGTPSVWCDPCLAPLVVALNAGGVPTVASCCGHGGQPGNIALADGRELLILPNFEAARAAAPPVNSSLSVRTYTSIQPISPEMAALMPPEMIVPWPRV